MRILGIDPGLATIGWGIIETNGFRHNSVAFGHIQTPTRFPVEKRLAMIYEDLGTIIKRYSPEAVAIEELFFNTNDFKLSSDVSSIPLSMAFNEAC